MLRDTEVKEADRIISALAVLDNKSNNRYRLDRLVIPLQQISAQMKEEAEILRRLELYHTQYGINTYKYINKVYPDLDTFKKEMTLLLQTCEKLKTLIIEYRQILNKIPFNKRRQLEQLLTQPDKLEEAQRLFSAQRHRNSPPKGGE